MERTSNDIKDNSDFFKDENVFLDADVLIQSPEKHIFSDEGSGGEDPDPDIIHLYGNQLRGQAELLEICFL